MLRRTWAEIHLERLQQNIQHIRAGLQPGCRMMAMVKADAYGHGAVPMARAMERYGIDWFGVSNLEEAIQLRRGGIKKPILIVSYTPPTEVVRLAEYAVTQSVVSAGYGRELSEAALAAGVELAVHIKVDTGMSRVGFVCHALTDAPSVADDIARVCRLPGLRAEGIFTHFVSADEQEDDGFTAHQFAMFQAVMGALGDKGVAFTLRHCCNSAATLRFPAYHLDMVRPGVVVYGLMPDDWMRDRYTGFIPVMELKTTVSMVKTIPAGQTISYNRTYTTSADTRLATVPIGYADGYSRRLTGNIYMLINGHPVSVIGRICMDQCMLDVTAMPEVAEGTVATVFGDGLPVDELAARLGTNHYEVVCTVSKRVPRLYLDGESLVEQLNYLV